MYANAYATTASQADMVDWGALRDQVEVEGGYQALLERDVVVRRLRPSAAASPRKRGRFIREIQTLAALHHHNFVRVYDAGLNDEVPFAVYERLQGITAQHRLELLQARGAAMELDEAVRIVRGVADGVEYARRRGVHVYDLTPPNITLTDDRRVVLTSLGQPLPDNPLTAPADVLAYTPPERLFGGVVEDDSEVYSLGVLLAHLIFGRLPFDGNAIAIIAQKQQSSSLPLLEDGRLPLGCPYPLATVMHRATSYEAGERYPSVEVFRMALLEALDDHPLKAQPLPSRAWRGEVVAPLEWPPAGGPRPPRAGR
ncbi:MAG TPA: serine/threonine-protein kinase, partial [Chloroflexaceae bacterium]|nr:serine/threonine-protein kinase [Chloroflexaceae bacterium]